ncbi:pentatricopeptide repeat-containing family protein [Striga asiatica]|uniref:Pentatricopeptide repeat-containing family protein n=1 Tax=Striga asiatica TaxID=4170 RepID=A0A5A7P2Y4_STRAF|nr:pentatricopeptide repeat-containing family protein [Striga asiatica]
MPNRVSVSTAANSYLRLLDACIASKSLKKGKTVHQRLLKINGPDFGSLAASSVPDKLARLYISCNSPQLAHRVFDSIPTHQKKSKTILWDQLIRAYAWAGPFETALDLYGQMMGSGVEPTKYTYPFVLKACAALQDFETGTRIHEQSKRYGLEKDVYVCTALVDFYVKCGCLVEAKNVFDKMPERDVVAWNALVNGFSSHGMYSDAVSLVCEMQKFQVDPNSSTVVAILPVLGEKGKSSEGKSVHGFCLRRGIDIDVVVGTGLLDMYGKCGLLIYAKRVFSSLKLRNEITWSAVIGACVDCGSINEAFGLFSKMKADEAEKGSSPVVLAALLRGCAKLNDSGTGSYLHCCFVKSGFARDLMTSNTILSMYTKCGSIEDGVRFFESMWVKDSVSYSAIISGSIQNGYYDKALWFFRRMQLAGLSPEPATMMGFFPACSNLSALRLGICGHGYSVVRGFASNISICNALIDMYGKCGNIQAARRVFDGMGFNNDVVSWNTMLVGYGINGLGPEAVMLFQEMRAIGPKPDEITFVALLSACSHSGLVDEGRRLFRAMREEFGLCPKMDHYFCMVDLLGRAGLLDEAYGLIRAGMPFEPDSHMWNALLAACRVHKNVELGERVSSEMFGSVGPSSTGNFVLLYNLYTTAMRWDDAEKVRIQQKELGFRKKPGCSWIQVNGTVHGFVGGDCSHERSSEIYDKLEELVVEMKRLGCRGV